MAEEKSILTYKGKPLMRKDNVVYYGSMADSHIVMLQILETKKVNGEDIASKVSVELQLTDPNARARDRIVKKSEKDGFYTALDVGCVWLKGRWQTSNVSIDSALGIWENRYEETHQNVDADHRRLFGPALFRAGH